MYTNALCEVRTALHCRLFISHSVSPSHLATHISNFRAGISSWWQARGAKGSFFTSEHASNPFCLVFVVYIVQNGVFRVLPVTSENHATQQHKQTEFCQGKHLEGFDLEQLRNCRLIPTLKLAVSILQEERSSCKNP